MLLLKNALFTVAAPGAVGFYVPLLLSKGRAAASGFTFIASLIMLGAGCLIYLWCVWDFASFGKGTPAPIDAPKKLVVRGLYKYTRNPMYIGVLLIVLGWAALYQDPQLILYALVVACCFHLFSVLYEERHLRATFGAEYDVYRAKVGRWIPRFWGDSAG